MNENEIALLKALGYEVNEFGGILDAEGNYLEEIEHNGTIIKSFQTRKEYDLMLKRHEKLKEINFKPNPKSKDNLQTQEEIALAKKDIQDYKKGMKNAEEPNWKDPYVVSALKEIKFDSIEIEHQNKSILIKDNTQQNRDKESTDIAGFLIPAILILSVVLVLIRFRKRIKEISNIRYYVFGFISSLLLSLYFGFKFKKYINETVLRKASLKQTKWQRDSYLEYQQANDSFFDLTNYNFNWEVFLFILLLSFLGIILYKRWNLKKNH